MASNADSYKLTSSVDCAVALQRLRFSIAATGGQRIYRLLHFPHRAQCFYCVRPYTSTIITPDTLRLHEQIDVCTPCGDFAFDSSGVCFEAPTVERANVKQDF